MLVIKICSSIVCGGLELFDCFTFIKAAAQKTNEPRLLVILLLDLDATQSKTDLDLMGTLTTSASLS
jgi:hypothetical protein